MKPILVKITKSARQFGYIIWNSRTAANLEILFNHQDTIRIAFNGIDLGEKKIDRKYNRISIGQQQTRSVPASHIFFKIEKLNGGLEVKTIE